MNKATLLRLNFERIMKLEVVDGFSAYPGVGALHA
jgi:hypothetical protein